MNARRWFVIVVFLLTTAPLPAAFAGDDTAALLVMHREILDAHMARDAARLLAPEPDTIVTVSRGEVSFSTKRERMKRFERYFDTTEFTAYRDVLDPVVRVSADGTLGWVIVQVEIAGTRAGEDGERIPFESVWGWIELYEKRDGRWYRTGTVSNRKPAP